MKSTKQIIKDSQTTADEVTNCLEACDNNIKDLYGEVTSFGKTGNKIIKDRISQVHSLFQNTKALHNEIIKHVKIIDGFSMKFYEDAKDIFKNLKNLHNDKMNDLKKLAEQGLNANESINSSNMKTIPSKKRGQSVSSCSNKPRNKLQIDTGCNSNQQQLQHQQHTISNMKSNLNKELNTGGSSINTNTNANTIGRNNKRNVNSITSNANSSNAEMVVDSMTAINELYEQNKMLKNQNAQLKNSLNQYIKKQNEQQQHNKTMPKSKSLRNFVGNVQKCVDNIIDNTKHNNEQCNQCKDIAEHVLLFLTAMKDLQTNIVKKSPNINELKKDFEKQKHDLNILAKSILSLNSNSSNPHNTNDNAINSNSNSNKTQIKELETKIKSLQNENELLKQNNKNEVDAVKSVLDELKKQNTIFKTHIEELEKNNKQLQNEKDNYEIKNKTILDELSKKSIELQTQKENEIILNTQIEKIKTENANEILNLKKSKQDLNKDINELKLTINKLNSSLQTAERKEKDNINEISKLKLKIESLITKSKQQQQSPKQQLNTLNSYSNEIKELVKMINKLYTYVNTKHKEIRNGSNNTNIKNNNEIIRNPNEAFLIDEDIMNMNIHKMDNSNGSNGDENDSILSNFNSNNNNNDNHSIDLDNNNNNNNDKNKTQLTKEQVALLMEKTRSVYNETNQILKVIFTIYNKKLNTNDNIKQQHINTNSNSNNNNNSITNANDIEILKKQYESVNNENQYLKSFFKECVNSIFASIKETAPHMVEDESEISFNIVSGPSTPNVNNNNNLLIDSKGKEIQNKDDDLLLLSSTFDPEVISTAVSKFKAYNEEITDQLKQLTLEKEHLEKEAHDNLVKAKAYKSALDDAISRVNASYTNTNEDINMNNNNNINNMNNNNNTSSLLHEGARAFTVEDLENPQSETPHSENKKHKVNDQLNEIKSDLLKQLHNKDDQIEQMQETINNLLAMANPQNKPGKTIKDKMVISAEKYDQLLNLYTNEQNKNRELRNTYYDFVSKFNAVEMENSPHKKELTLGNDDEENEEEDEDDKKQMNVEYQINQVEIQEMMNENKDLKERETLLMTQLNEVKDELKETRKQVQELIIQNTKLKEDINDNSSLSYKNEEFIGTLRNAIERLVNEMQITSKIKEFLTVVLRLVGYTEEQILTIYQAKEKKKGFFNKFK